MNGGVRTRSAALGGEDLVGDLERREGMVVTFSAFPSKFRIRNQLSSVRVELRSLALGPYRTPPLAAGTADGIEVRLKTPKLKIENQICT